MFIATIPNRGSPPTILVRESYREKGKVKTRTLSNITKLPNAAIEVLKKVFKGETIVSAKEEIEIIEDGSCSHGHVEAVMTAMEKLKFEKLLDSRPSRMRSLVVAMVAARILKPQSKIATTRWWSGTTLPEILGVSDADEDELYEAMDWLLEKQNAIEKKLAKRHLQTGGFALYDLTSSYFEGETCPLAARGHNRDKKKGKLQVNYGLLTNEKGIPVSVSVFKGNTGDPKTVMPQLDTLRNEFDIEEFVLVGDRGMITQKQINQFRNIDGVDWITALRSGSIKKLVESGSIQMGLFDERNLFEFVHTDFPGERLVACRNPEIAKRRDVKRKKLLEATVNELEKVCRMVKGGKLYGKEIIKDRIEKVLKQYKVGKHYKYEVRDNGFDYEVNRDACVAEATANNRRQTTATDKQLARCEKNIISVNKKLDKIRQRTEQGRLRGKDEIALRTGKVVNKYKVAKHFLLHIEDNSFDFEINQQKVDAEAALDGIYVVRTSVAKEKMNTNQTVRSYKLLSNVERAFRCLKSVDLMVRPIRHRLETRVRAHIFLCMLAYYVQWHMLEAWRPILFADEEQKAKTSRDPVAPAQRSDSALKKVHTKQLDDETIVHSFRTMLENLSNIVRNTCRIHESSLDLPTFRMTTMPNSKQQTALNLLKDISL